MKAGSIQTIFRFHAIKEEETYMRAMLRRFMIIILLMLLKELITGQAKTIVPFGSALLMTRNIFI